MRQGIKTMMAGVAVGVVVLAGCSKDASADLKKQLTDGGMSAENSDCIVKGLSSRGVPLDSYDTPSSADQAKITEAVGECMGAPVTTTTP